jgi:hypothetical protein
MMWERTVSVVWGTSASATTTSGMLVDSDNKFADYTDGAGHGILLASQQVSVGCTMVNIDGACQITLDLWMKFRFKEVSLEEYIGLVQQSTVQIST